MANLERAKRALIEADRMGDTEAAQQLANYIRSQQQAPAPQMPMQPEVPRSEMGFFGRMGKNIGERMSDLGDTYNRFNLPDEDPMSQNIASTALQTVGAGAGVLSDALAEAGVSGFRALPDAIEMPIREAASFASKSIAGTDLGQQAIEAIQGGAESYRKWKEINPEAAANIESVVNIGSVFPLVKPAAKAAQTGVKAVKAASKPVSRAAGLLLGQADEGIKALGQRAVDFDIPLRFDQVKPSQMSKTVQKVSQSIPGSGTAAFEDLQKTAWNKALAKTIGVDDLKPKSISLFKKQNSTMFDDVLKNNKVNVSAEDMGRLDSIKNLDVFDLTPGDEQIVLRDIKKTISDLGIGKVSGQKLSSARSYLLKKADRAGNATPFYEELINTLDDIAKKSLNPKDVEKLDLARKQYKNFKTMQPLLQEGIEVDPKRLMQRVASSRYIDASSLATGQDDLVDLARIGKNLLTKQGGSDTFEKAALLGGGGLGTYGLMSDPVTSSVVGSTVLGGNRALQSGVLRNQALINQMLGAKGAPLSLSQINQLSPRDAMLLLGGSSALGLDKEY